ncbi:MAG: hypothetical protein E7576_16185 [Ruminococcaceae bacterium]|jgi:hypothetical protein|nr:hypothetical protein [Oscillospiraceae bacterium]
MSRWTIHPTENAVVWTPALGEAHTDDYEMAGYRCAFVVKYGTDERGFVLTHHPIFPTLRLRPNNTHATYQMDVPDEKWPRLVLLPEREPVKETLVRVKLNGTIEIETTAAEGRLKIRRICFPSTEVRAAYEILTAENTGAEPLELGATILDNEVDQTMGPMGINICEIKTDLGSRLGILSPGASFTAWIAVTGRVANENPPAEDPAAEYLRRLRTIERLTAPMKLETGNRALDLMFRFAKLRAGESVYRTRYGLIHSPGGYSYFAATWCNDQVEYAGPYFAYTGDPDLIEASLNAYRMYMPFMSDRYEPIPSSVIAEGIDYWNGAGDRGDAAMYLYGAARFALTVGDREIARELWPAVKWCAEYCERKKNAAGVIASDRDELEGRFPSGDANLCTSTLCYAGLLAAAELADVFGEDGDQYRLRAGELRDAIERVFGHTIHGIPAYRYYDGCEVMRSWICMPLCVGIYDRAGATVEALTSRWLMRPDGFLTSEESETIWDRSTLYSLRGIFASGYTEEAFSLLSRYVENRLLSERVPYAVEAYPEGGRRQLSGESALFCKVILEGMLDLTPASLTSFTVKPTLPAGLDHITLENIRAFGGVFTVSVKKDGWTVSRSDGVLLGEGKNGEKGLIPLA